MKNVKTQVMRVARASGLSRQSLATLKSWLDRFSGREIRKWLRASTAPQLSTVFAQLWIVGKELARLIAMVRQLAVAV